jgi:hypothetical protein
VGCFCSSLVQLKNKSTMTAAEVRAELSKMRDSCKKQFTDWFNKGGPELGTQLLAKTSSRTQVCSVQDVVKLLMQGVDVEGSQVVVCQSVFCACLKCDTTGRAGPDGTSLGGADGQCFGGVAAD